MKPLRFSQRIGKVSVRQALQIECIDDILANRLWNSILINIIEQLDEYSRFGNSERGLLFKSIWLNFFHKRVDEIPSYNDQVFIEGIQNIIKNWFFGAAWYEQYDFIEFLIPFDKQNRFSFTESVRHILQQELAGYTIINNQIVPITSEHEIASIEEALNNSSKYSSVETHLQKALEMLSDRQSPDYRNSIKESVSAVEAYCKILTDDSKATLGEALKQMEKSHKLHSALKVSFTALYGYTSDSGGIRHSLLEDDISVTFEDAKFMLVSCSAFFNYLKARES